MNTSDTYTWNLTPRNSAFYCQCICVFCTLLKQRLFRHKTLRDKLLQWTRICPLCGRNWTATRTCKFVHKRLINFGSESCFERAGRSLPRGFYPKSAQSSVSPTYFWAVFNYLRVFMSWFSWSFKRHFFIHFVTAERSKVASLWMMWANRVVGICLVAPTDTVI